MLHASLLLVTLVAPQQPGVGSTPVVINEFSYDDTGTNDRVFVELYNRSSGPVDISGWILLGVDGTTVGNGSVAIPASTVLAPGQFYVIGQAESIPAVPFVGVPNVDLDVPTLPTVLEVGPDGLVLQDTALNYIDGVTWEQFGWTNPLPTWLEGDGLQGDIQNSDSNPQSASRVFDGYDTDDNGCDFRVARWSPGTPNNTAHTSGQAYGNNFDVVVGSTVDAAFNYSFVPGTTADPAALGIPASPQGGNCSTWFDPGGGGNANYFSAAARQDWLVDSYVYLRGPAAAFDSDDVETWAMGVRGSTDSFGEPPDINGLFLYAGLTWQAGITGIAWFQVITQTSSNLYLVDFDDGGPGFTILHTVPITADGWTRVRLGVIGGDVVGNLGGTHGCDNGIRYLASGASVCSNGIYIQYRENVSGAHRPLALDALQIAPNVSASVTLFGTGSATNTGVPVIAATGLPTLGNLAYAITGSNLVPNGFSFTLLQIGPPTIGLQIPGAQTGALSYMYTSGVSIVFMLNGPAGTISQSMAIPCATGLTNLPITAQIVDVDISLPDPVPFGTSQALQSIVGN